jgi:hypothetical protein
MDEARQPVPDGERLPPVDAFPAWDTYGIDDTCEHEHRHAEEAPVTYV